MILVRCFNGPMMLQPRSWVYLSLSCSSRLFLVWLLASLSLHYKSCSGLGSDRLSDEAFSSLCLPSQATFPSACSSCPTKTPCHSLSLVQWRSTWPFPVFFDDLQLHEVLFVGKLLVFLLKVLVSLTSCCPEGSPSSWGTDENIWGPSP